MWCVLGANFIIQVNQVFNIQSRSINYVITPLVLSHFSLLTLCSAQKGCTTFHTKKLTQTIKDNLLIKQKKALLPNIYLVA